MKDAMGTGSNSFITENATRADNTNRGLMAFHGSHLQSRGMGTQSNIRILVNEESILHIACRVLFREIKSSKDMPIVFNIGTGNSAKSDFFKNAANLIHHN